jgi:hypothetical protein
MVLLALTSNHRFGAIAIPIPESGRSCETAEGREDSFDAGGGPTGSWRPMDRSVSESNGRRQSGHSQGELI